MVEDRYESDGCMEVPHSPNPRGEGGGVDVDAAMPPPLIAHRRQLAHPVPGKQSLDDKQAIAALMELPSSPFRSPCRTPSGGRCYVGSSGMGGLGSPLPKLLGGGSPYRDPCFASPFTKFAGSLSPLIGSASSQSDMISTSAASTPLLDDGGGVVSRAFRSPTRTDATLSHHCSPSILSPLLLRQQGVKSSLRRLVHIATPERNLTWQIDSSSHMGIAPMDGVAPSPAADGGCMRQLLGSIKETEGGGSDDGFKLMAGLGKGGKGPGGGLMVCVQEVNPEAQFSVYPASEELAALLGLSRTELSSDLGGVDSDYDSTTHKGGTQRRQNQESDDDGTEPSLGGSSRNPSPYEQGERLFPDDSPHDNCNDGSLSDAPKNFNQVRGKSLASTPGTTSPLDIGSVGRSMRRTYKRTFHDDDEEDTQYHTPSSHRKRTLSTSKSKVNGGKRISTLKRVEIGGSKHKTVHKMGASRASKKLKSASHDGGRNGFDSPVSTDPMDRGISPPNMSSDGEDCRGGKPSHVIHPCTCKKSRCLKLYCDCFANSKQCSAACKCVGCLNRIETEDKRQAAIQSTLSRNPKAFCNKVQQKPVGVDNTHSVGCNCKKSACLKKYCECFQLGMTCGGRCKCVSCLNFDGSEDLAIARHKVGRSGHVRVVPTPRLSLSAPESTVKVLSVLDKERTTKEDNNPSVGEEGDEDDKPVSVSQSKEQVPRSLLCLLPDAVSKRSSSISAAPHRFSAPLMIDDPVATCSKFEASVEQEGVK